MVDVWAGEVEEETRAEAPPGGASGPPWPKRVRIPCRLVCGEREFKGWAVSLSPSDVRVELELAALLQEADDVCLWLSCELPARTPGAPPLPWDPELRGGVVERVLPLGTAAPSVLVHLFEPPEDYHAHLEQVPAAPEPVAGPSTGVAPSRARALLVGGEGSLGEIAQLVDDLGGTHERIEANELEPFTSAEEAPRVLVVDANAALSIEIPENTASMGVVSIAIADSSSTVLSSLLWKLGFDYVVRLPAHPEVVRLLFKRALHRGGDRRASERIPIGRTAWLRDGLRRHRCTVLDLSEGGCRVAVHGSVEMLAPITIQLGPSITRGRSLSIRGRVVRRRLGKVPGETSLGVRFLSVTGPTRKRLRAIFQQRIVGPTIQEPSLVTRLRIRMESLMDRVLAPWHRIPELEAERPVSAERREYPRVRLGGEVLSLREGAVDRVLIGRDLSLGGLRVEPHPELVIGERLNVSLYDALHAEPLLMVAEVVRDDGEGGVALQFQDVSQAGRDRLGELVDSLPMVEWLGGGPERVAPVVIVGFEGAGEANGERSEEASDSPAASEDPGSDSDSPGAEREAGEVPS